MIEQDRNCMKGESMKEQEINWEMFECHIREALGSLNNLYEYIKAKRDGGKPEREMTIGQFAAEYEHVYHHLNFGWNTRMMDWQTADTDFETNEKMPDAFKMELPILIGMKEDKRPLVVDLASLPHILIAGACGQGKTTFLESMLQGFVSQFAPEEVGFVLYDEKCVEFVGWENSEYLEMPIAHNTKEAMAALKMLEGEMDIRLKMLASSGFGNIHAFNHREGGIGRFKYLIFVADEICDLIATEGKRVVSIISRLTAMGRAVGIHLVLATQRPDIRVLSGRLKANIQARIAFKTCTALDSERIVGERGAEELKGRGDLLFSCELGKVVRAQGVYVPCKDEPASTIEDQESLSKDYQRAVEYAHHKKRVFISSLQQDLGFGYNRAAKIYELMKENGLVKN